MSYLLWNNHDYSVQIPFIDNEHKVLIALVNEIEDAMDFHVLFHNQFMLDKIDNLFNGIKNHIASEEKYLIDNNYPELESHRLEHTLIIERLNEFESWFKEAGKPFNEKMLLYLKDLLVRHFILSDHKYGYYFHLKKLSSSLG
jgi:hemerythrin-like metal-binding protein